MNQGGRGASWRGRALYVSAGVLSSVGFMLLAARRLSLAEVGQALASAKLWPWLPLAVGCYVLGHAARGVRCQRLASAEAKLSTATATNVVVLGYAVNNILPARLGEFARAAMLAERTGLPFVQGLSVTFLERILDGVVILGLLGAAYLSLPGSAHAAWLDATLRLSGVVFSCAVLLVAAAVMAPSLLVRWTSRLSGFSPRLHDALVQGVDHATRGVAYLREPRAALGVLSLSLLVWLCESGLFICLLPAFGLPLDPRVGLLAMTVTNLGILVPSSPGFIGPFHYFCMRALGAVGVSETLGFSYAALVHLAFYVPITVWGVAIISSYGFKLGQAADARKAAEPLSLLSDPERFRTPSRVADGPAPPFILALCEALIPADELGGARAQVTSDCSAFVHGQLRALPMRLRVYFACGMLFFRTVTLLRFLRTFCAVPLAERSAWVGSWAYGSFALGRQLFKAPRATVFVAYYEHPAVNPARGAAPAPAQGLLQLDRARREAPDA